MRMEFEIAMVTGTLNLLTLISLSVFVWVALLVDRKAKTNSSTLNEKFEYSLIHSFTQFPTSKIQFNQIETNHPAGDLTQNIVRFFHSQKDSATSKLLHFFLLYFFSIHNLFSCEPSNAIWKCFY